MARFERGKPRPKGAGRKKGTPNKVTVAAKQAMLQAFAELGGVAGLVRWARSKKPAKGLTEFYKLWAKTLPREISGPDSGPIPFADMTTDAIRDELRRLRELTEARTAAGIGAGAGISPSRNGGPVPAARTE